MQHSSVKSNPDYELFTATTFDNRHHLPADFISDLEKMETESPKKYNRYVMNSDEDYDLEGAFYASLMSEALKDGRVGLNTLYEPTARVFTFWDLGVRASDSTAVWLAQFVRSEIWLIDYYENYGEGMEHYAAWLEQRKYVYGGDYLPHDGKNRLQGRRIETRIEILKDLRRNPVYTIEQHRKADRIQLCRNIIPRCLFSEKCERGVDCLNHYKRKKNELLSTEAKPVFADEPLHDWASNGADAFGYMAYAYRYMTVGGVVYGQTDRDDEYACTDDMEKAYEEYPWI